MVEDNLKNIEKKVSKNPAYSKKLGGIPLLCRYAGVAKLMRKNATIAEARIDQGLRLVVNHPDKDVLIPFLNLAKAQCMAETHRVPEALELIKESRAKLDKLLGKTSFTSIKALNLEVSILTSEKNYKEAIKLMDELIRRCQISRRISYKNLLKEREKLKKLLDEKK